MPRLCSLLLVAGSMLAAQSVWEFDSRGNLVFGGDLAGIRATVNMHGPGWSSASQASASLNRQETNAVAGQFPTPANCRGELVFACDARTADGAVELTYSLRFTEATDITGAYVSLFLPVTAFAGQAIALLRSEGGTVLPADQGGATVLSGDAPGLFVGGETGLAVAMNANGSVHVQDNRQYGSDVYELRFALFGNGPVRPGIEARRVFRIARATRAEAEEMATHMNPPREIRSGQPYLLHEDDGTLQLRDGRNRQLLTVMLAVHGPNWSYQAQSGATVASVGDAHSRSVAGALEVRRNPAGTVIEFAQTTSEIAPRQARVAYRLHFPTGALANGYQTAFTVPLGIYSGKTFSVRAPDGTERSIAIPETVGESFLHDGPVAGFSLAPGTPQGFRVQSEPAQRLLVQDNRNWGGDSIEFRFAFARVGEQDGDAVRIPAGHTTEAAFDLFLPPETHIVLDQAASPSRTDTSDWIPFTLPWDSAPVDVSFLNHKPAGKFGFVEARDGRFVFADSGEEIRFWGTCFSAGANFPTREQSEIIARRLAAFGINMVRPHHADAPWAERHFFPRDADNTRVFDAENLDRFDYLVHCLKREGIYIYLDQLVHRRFKPGDGVDAVDQLEPAGKPYSNFDPRLIELQKEFSRNLWTHVNPYTGLAYKDDPAIALMEFANENDLFSQTVELEPYRSRFETSYRAWAAEQGIAVPEGKVDFARRTDPIMRFMVEVQANYCREMERYLRDEVGVRVPMTGSNWTRNAALLLSLAEMPFTDSHAYHNHPSRDGRFGNTPMVGGRGTIMDGLGFHTLPGKPFFISEWDQPWPNEWRAELPLWIAAVSAFQGWNGLTVYTYRHTTRLPVDSITGAFETFNDPARFGLFPHAALIYRRGDFAESEEMTLVRIPESLAASERSPTPWGSPAYRGLAESRRFRTVFADEGGVPHDQPLVEGNRRISETGQIRRDIESRILLLDSPRTQAITGFLEEAGKQATSGLEVESGTLFATVAASALDDQPLAESGRILLTAVGRAENTGFAYNLLRNRRAASGTGPILADPVRAHIAIRTSQTNLRVAPVAADGTRGEPLAAAHVDGILRFEIGPEAKTIYYLLEN